MPFDSMKSLVGLQDGAVMGGRRVPLERTDIKVRVRGGLATVSTARTFRNTGERPMEAMLTYPVPVQAVVHGLEAMIGERVIKAAVKVREKARETYESGMDRGKASLLHEQVAAGVHMLSVGQVAPGVSVTATVTWSMALEAAADGSGSLSLPMTIGDIYGTAPMQDSDAPLHAAYVHNATLFVDADTHAMHDGKAVTGEGVTITLDMPALLTMPTPAWGAVLRARNRRGEEATLSFFPQSPSGAGGIVHGHLLLDNSGSMGQAAHHHTPGVTKHMSATSGLRLATRSILPQDMLSLWEYNNEACHITDCRGADGVLRALSMFNAPYGGTRTGHALSTVLSADTEGDVVLVTDGKSWDISVDDLVRQAAGRRVHAVLVGLDALDGLVGELVRRTGGETYTVQSRCDDGIIMALGALRRSILPRPTYKDGRITHVSSYVAGVMADARWKMAGTTAGTKEGNAETSEAILSYMCHMALPHLQENQAALCAQEYGVVSHLTSLVLVDEEGVSVEGLPDTCKVSLSTPKSAFSFTAQSAGDGRIFRSLSVMSASAHSNLKCANLTSDEQGVERMSGLIPASVKPSSLKPIPDNIWPTIPDSVRPRLPPTPWAQPVSNKIWPTVEPRLPPAPWVHPGQPMPHMQAPTNLEQLSGLVDWDKEAGRILSGDLRHLGILVRHALDALMTDAIRSEAAMLGIIPETLLLSRAAALVKGSRSAQRLVRHVESRRNKP